MINPKSNVQEVGIKPTVMPRDIESTLDLNDSVFGGLEQYSRNLAEVGKAFYDLDYELKNDPMFA